METMKSSSEKPQILPSHGFYQRSAHLSNNNTIALVILYDTK